jgi:hypothetical protein
MKIVFVPNSTVDQTTLKARHFAAVVSLTVVALTFGSLGRFCFAFAAAMRRKAPTQMMQIEQLIIRLGRV